MSDINLRQLLQAGVHFGHQRRYWSPEMAPYIYGEHNKIHIIDLEKTLPMLKEAMNCLGSMIAENKKILFVGTKRQAGRIVREQAQKCGCPYVDYRWLGGMLTNYKTVKNSIARLKELEQRIESGEVARLSKKEGLSLERERAKLDKTLSGIKDMNGLPDALFVIDVEHEYIAVAEANKLGIPVIAVVDSNCSPKGINYIIPGNDDSTKAITLYLTTAADTILASKAVTTPIAAYQGDEDYVEVDDAGKIVASKTATDPKPAASSVEEAKEEVSEETPVIKKKAKKKIVVKKKTVSSKTADAEAETDATATAEKAVEKKVTKKKTTKKKVTKKKVAKKKDDE